MTSNGIPSNKVNNQIADINLEINYFLERLSNFRKLNVVDRTVCDNLQKVLESIDELFEDPVVIASTQVPTINSQQNNYNINFEKHCIERMNFCHCCQTEIPNKAPVLKAHIGNHKHNVALNIYKNGNIKELEKFYKNQLNDGTNENGSLTLKQAQQLLKPAIKEIKQRKEDRADKQNKKKRESNHKLNLPKKLTGLLGSSFEIYLNDMTNLANKMKLLPLNEEIRKSLRNIIKNIYPNVQVYCFGSRVNGLATTESDLDIYIDINGLYNTYYPNKDDIVKIIGKIGSLLHSNMEWKKIQAITSARVPILRVYNLKRNIDCDLSFSNGLSECNSLLVRYLFDCQPICQKICFFVKKWIKLSAVGDQITTYTVILMVIFFMQQRKLLPSIRSLQLNLEPALIGPWQGNFHREKLEKFGIEKMTDTPENVRKLIKTFLEFYADFEFNKFVVCPYEGVPVSRNEFNSSTEGHLERYHKYLESTSVNKFQLDRPICVQDPLELNHNVAKGVPKTAIKLLKHYMSLSVVELELHDARMTKLKV